MFPLSTVLFPCAHLSLHVFEERYRGLMADCLAGDQRFGVVLITRGSEVGGGDQRVDVGTVAQITDFRELADGRMLVAAQGTTRFVVEQWLEERPHPRALVGELPLDRRDGDAQKVGRAEQVVRRLRSLASELGSLPALPHDLDIGAGLENAEQTGWCLCDLAPLNLLDRQRLLAAGSLSDQMELLCELSAAMADDVVSLLTGGHDPAG
jgi:Lon protease-like protein